MCVCSKGAVAGGSRAPNHSTSRYSFVGLNVGGGAALLYIPYTLLSEHLVRKNTSYLKHISRCNRTSALEVTPTSTCVLRVNIFYTLNAKKFSEFTHKLMCACCRLD